MIMFTTGKRKLKYESQTIPESRIILTDQNVMFIWIKLQLNLY